MSISITQSCAAIALVSTFLLTAICLHVQQWLGAPLYYIQRSWYYRWQAIVKESAALLLIGLNQLRAPSTVCISGDASVADQQRNGKEAVFDFPDRIVLIANHQIYTDWIFFWWSAYIAKRHGYFYVILKDSLKKIPIIGPGMKFFQFIFLSRKWETDKVNFEAGVNHLATCETSSPMWLLIFPEGTNMSRNARAASKKWSEKSGVADLQHALIPRTRGLQCCLQGLAGTVEWMYDCTIAYENIPTGQWGQELFSLKKLYLDGCRAPPAHMHWRRFAIKDIPYQDVEELEKWLLQRWREKDQLLEQFQQQGKFPAADGRTITNVKLRGPWEAAQILLGVVSVAVVWSICRFVYYQIMG